MKRTFLLKTMLLLCALVAGSSSVWADEVTWSGTSALPGTLTNVGSNDNIQIQTSSTNTYTNPIRIYANTTITIKANNGCIIQSVTYEASSTGNYVTYAQNATVTPNVTPTVSDKKVTWTYSTDVTEFTFTPSSQTRANSIQITYTVDNRTEVNLTSFTAEKTTLIVGNEQATAVTNDQSGWTAAYTYSSEDESVATISNSGVITAIGKGTTKVWVELNVASTDATYKKGSTYKKSIDITVNNPSHTAQFSVNGVIDPANSVEVEEDDAITFPADPAAIGGQTFMGWTTAPIDGTQADAPSTLITTATTPMGTDDVTYYAVFAKETTGEGDVTLTITSTTDNFPDSYGSANTFTEYTLEGKKFKIQQGFVNGTKLQWRASGNSNGTGTMYNTEALSKIQSIVLTYNSSDNNKNFTVKVGNSENPTSGTEITPSSSGVVYTFDCSSHNANYFVMTNGINAGYLDEIAIKYKAETTIYSDYCTTVVPGPSEPEVNGNTVTLTTTANMNGWRAFYDASQGYTANNAKVYVVSSNSTTKVMLSDIGLDIPAGTPVILKANTGLVITLTKSTPAAYTGDNELNVSTAGQNLGTVYRLGYGDNGVGFYQFTSSSAPAGIVYLENVNGAPSLGIEIGDATAIEAATKSQLTETVVYNLNGQRVAQPTKGLYIVNGKKVVVK